MIGRKRRHQLSAPEDMGRAPSSEQATKREGREFAVMSRENGGYSAVPGLVALVGIYVVFGVLYPSMFHPYTIYSILLEMGSYGFIALGVVLVLIIAEIDLSIGSVAGLGSAVVGALIVNMGVDWLVAVAAGIAAGVAVGTLQGLLVTKLGVPSFVITLGGLLSWEGVQLLIPELLT